MPEENLEQQQNLNLLEPKPLFKQERPPKSKRHFLLFLLISTVLVIGYNLTIHQFTLAKLPEDASLYDPVTLRPKRLSLVQTVRNIVFGDTNFLDGESEDRINILLLGMGGAGHDGPYLTDTNILLSLKPSTKQVAMISIPRDLGVNIPEWGLRKINNANAYGEVKTAGGGGEFAREIFSETFDVEIPYYIRVDFAAFSEIIDAVGGVDINVATSFTDTAYPGPENSYQTVRFYAGQQTMNGETALKYARSRHGDSGEGSDFARARRQQQLLLALKSKLLSFGTYTNPVKIQRIIETLSTHVSTNLDFGQIMYLAGMAREANDNIKTMTLDDGPNGYLTSFTSPEAGYILIPKTENFNIITENIKNIFIEKTVPTIQTPPAEIITEQNSTPINKPIFAEANIEIQNGTWRVGLAGRTKDYLQKKGFTIASVSNAMERPLPTTTIYLLKENIPTEIVLDLKTALDARVSDRPPEWLQKNFDNPKTAENELGPKYQENSDILVILGEDYRE